MSKRAGRFLKMVLLGLFLIRSPKLSATLAIDFTGGSSYYGGDITVGWEFQTAVPLTLVGLGLWDLNGNGLGFTHQVGLWGGDGSSLLASTSITNASTPVQSLSSDGRWLFNDVPPLTLPPGDYVIGAAYSRDYPSLEDGIQEGGETSISLSTVPGVTFVEPRTAYGFSYPGTAQPAVKIGEFGPNLEVTSTPEPSMTALIGLGSVCLLFSFWRVHWL